ncbi:MAG: inositol-3-phosphate synthase, partial [Elusimicrobia bacterium]|nr:inositol-3-phosphate synthase [Elusimicrobiota bacterium]
YPMQLKINFLCRDSILAAPIVLDLALFSDLAARAGLSGIQEWLSFYYKSPMAAPGLDPEHDLFIQQMKLKNTLRLLMGEEVLDHSGLDYYDVEKGSPAPAAAPRPVARKKPLAKTAR